MKASWKAALKVVPLAVLFLASSFATGQKPKLNGDCCSIVERAIQAVDHIKKGMTRAEVEKYFQVDEGLYSRDHSFYTFRECPLIKIKIDFDLDPSYKGFATGSPKDKVVSVSQPYLQYEVKD